MGVDAEGEVVVDDAQRQILLALFVRLHAGVLLHLQLPSVEQHGVAVTDVAQDCRNGLVGITLSADNATVRPVCCWIKNS